MYEIDMDNISYEEAFDADSHFGADDLSSAQFGWLAAAGVAITGAGMLLYNCLENASEYRDIKEKYNAHPAGRETNYWETVKDKSNHAHHALSDYDDVCYIDMGDGMLIPIFDHHPPNPQSTLVYLSQVKETLSAASDKSAILFTKSLDQIESEITAKNYSNAQSLLKTFSAQAKTVQSPYVAQAQPLQELMDSAHSASVRSGIGAAVAATGAVVAGAISIYEDDYY